MAADPLGPSNGLLTSVRISVPWDGGGLRSAPATVGKWRRRYSEQGIYGLLDEPRVGRPREVVDDTIEQIIVDTLQRKSPGEATHWSARSMAKHAQVSQKMVSRV